MPRTKFAKPVFDSRPLFTPKGHRTKFPKRQVLPDFLKPGTYIRIGDFVARLERAGTDRYDQPTFQLKTFPRTVNGWTMPGVTTNGVYSRDDLEDLKAIIVDRVEVRAVLLSQRQKE